MTNEKSLMGEIADEFNDLLKSTKRKDGELPHAVEKLIQQMEKDGQDKITSMSVIRSPVQAYVGVLMNAIAKGRYAETIAESEYDTMFHLGIQINGKYRLEKNAVIAFYEVGSKVSSGSQTSNPVTDFMSSLTKTQNKPRSSRDSNETSKMRLKEGDSAQPMFMRVALPRGDGDTTITIRSLLEKTREFMGDDKFTNYSARHNNCQDFVLGVLSGNDLKTDLLQKFIHQDAESIFKELPEQTTGVANTFTDLGARGDNLMEHALGEARHLMATAKQIFQGTESA